MPDGPERESHADRNAQQTPSQLDRDMVKWTRAVAWFTGLLFLANIISNWFIYEQWSVANKSQIDTREQLRAVVTFGPFAELIPTDKDGKPAAYAFIPQFLNTGGTRTAIFRPWGSIHYFDGEVPNNVDFSKPWNKIEITDGVIGANGTGQITPLTLTPDEAEKIRQKSGTGLIWGHADWADIFQPQAIHGIDYCYRLESVITVDGKSFLQPIAYKTECNANK